MNKKWIERYIPTHEEALEDAKFLLEGYVNKVRCDICGYRIAWRDDKEKETIKACTCSKTPSWYQESLTYLTYQDIVDIFNEMFGKVFSKWIYDQFFGAIQARQLRNKLDVKNKVEAELKKLSDK